MKTILHFIFFSIYSFSRKIGLTQFPENSAVLGLTLICIFLFAPLTAGLFFALNILNRSTLSIAGIITFLLIFRTFSDYSGDSAPPFRCKRRHLKGGGFVMQY